MIYRGDFHIHSCLSPCASLEMSPSAIVERAVAAGLNAVALTDHNAPFNLPAFEYCCRKAGLKALYGMEVTSVEEAHLLCLFDSIEPAMELGQLIYDSLPEVENIPERFGDQVIVDEHEDILGFADKFLISASAYDVSAILSMVHSMGGLFVPAHIDRQVYGIIAQLGFLPDEAYDAIELTSRGDAKLAQHYPVLRSSDSHQLDSIGAAFTEFEADSFTVAALRAAWWSKK
jgi:3',5'-nucleoside bisphosphate phosphatase